jgi:hypothetical protein
MATRRIQVNYSHALISGPAVSFFYFESSVGTAAQAATAVAGFFTSIADRLHSGLTVGFDPDVVVFDTATGHPTDFESITQANVVGTVGFEPLPPAISARVDLGTSAVVNFRRLKGRIYIPMMTEGQNQGAPESGTIGDVSGSAQALRDDANTLWVVWSRTHGVNSAVTTAQMWSKWGIQRSRRD